MPRLIDLLFLFSLGFCGAQAIAADDADILKNWFNDPFFQVRDTVKACPVPLGPLMTEKQRNAEAHYRVERGTSCWLAGKCDKPNSYLYDAPIAEAIRQRFSQTTELNETSLWITVQRRFVIVQGCTNGSDQAAQIEALLASVPDVERVILQLISSPREKEKPPYLLAPGQTRSTDSSK
jgi:hypothetical protein